MLRSLRNLTRDTWPEGYTAVVLGLVVVSEVARALARWSVRP